MWNPVYIRVLRRCVRGDLSSLTRVGSLSRNNSLVRPSRYSSVNRDRRRLSSIMTRGAAQAVCVARVRGCPVCPDCALCSPVAGSVCSRGPCFLCARWFVRCWYFHATIAFIPRSIPIMVVCSSRSLSVVVHDARNKRSSGCDEKGLFCVLSALFFR